MQGGAATLLDCLMSALGSWRAVLQLQLLAFPAELERERPSLSLARRMWPLLCGVARPQRKIQFSFLPSRAWAQLAFWHSCVWLDLVLMNSLSCSLQRGVSGQHDDCEPIARGLLDSYSRLGGRRPTNKRGNAPTGHSQRTTPAHHWRSSNPASTEIPPQGQMHQSPRLGCPAFSSQWKPCPAAASPLHHRLNLVCIAFHPKSHDRGCPCPTLPQANPESDPALI